MAAGISSQFGIGLEYALKKYVIPNGTPDFRRQSRLDENVELCITQYDRVVHAVYAFPKEDGSPEGEFFSGMSLLKALTTLQSAHHLAQMGLLLEPMVIIRSAIEMLAWSRMCQELKEDKTYLEMTTNEAITLTKSTLSTLPKLYGVLSKFAHWHPDVHLSFMTSHEGVGVISKSLDFKPSTLIAVTSAYIISFSVFSSIMTKYWPDRDIRPCKNCIIELAAAADELHQKTSDQTRLKVLVNALYPIMKASLKAIEE